MALFASMACGLGAAWQQCELCRLSMLRLVVPVQIWAAAIVVYQTNQIDNIIARARV
jgi:hypothetical protein